MGVESPVDQIDTKIEKTKPNTKRVTKKESKETVSIESVDQKQLKDESLVESSEPIVSFETEQRSDERVESPVDQVETKVEKTKPKTKKVTKRESKETVFTKSVDQEQ